MTPAILMSSVFCICHSALACPHESGECGIQYFVCLWIPVTRLRGHKLHGNDET